MKKIISICLITYLLLLSCDYSSNLNQFEDYKKSTESFNIKQKKEDALKEFAKKHISISKEIISILKKSEKSITFDDNSYFQIYQLKTEREVLIFFKNKGINDPNFLITNLKKLEANYNLLMSSCSEFAKLSNNQKTSEIEKYLDEEINNDNFFYDLNSQNSRISCQGQYKLDIERCKRNQAIGLGFSFVTGLLTGSVGGWLGAAASTTAYHYCVQDAIQDLNNCRDN